MNITLEELAPYLPYKLKCKTDIGILELTSIDKNSDYECWFGYREVWHFNHKILSQTAMTARGYKLWEVKPILRPLSDLDKGMFDEEAEYLIGRIIKGHTVHYGSLSYTTIQYLSKNHYDFQNLIMKGLAIDINTIKDDKEPQKN